MPHAPPIDDPAHDPLQRTLMKIDLRAITIGKEFESQSRGLLLSLGSPNTRFSLLVRLEIDVSQDNLAEAQRRKHPNLLPSSGACGVCIGRDERVQFPTAASRIDVWEFGRSGSRRPAARAVLSREKRERVFVPWVWHENSSLRDGAVIV
jgi:hypothetical protein